MDPMTFSSFSFLLCYVCDMPIAPVDITPLSPYMEDEWAA
jgi:hypothetical protein